MSALRELPIPHAALTADEQQLLVYLVWLLEPLAENDRETVLSRLHTRLSRAGSDHLALMHELENTISALEAAEPAPA